MKKLLLIAFLFCSLITRAQYPAFMPEFKVMNISTDIQSHNASNGAIVLLRGLDSTNDGGGGWFVFNSSSTATTDGINVFAVTGVTPGRWLRMNIYSSGGGTVVDTSFQWSVLDSISIPAVGPATGDIYLVGTAPTGAWTGHANEIATWDGAAWTFQSAAIGDLLNNAANNIVSKWTGTVWIRVGKAVIHQGGDRYAQQIIIGSIDNANMRLRTHNLNRITIANTGATTFNFLTGTGNALMGLDATGLTSRVFAVDTIYRTAGKDSIQFTIGGRYHAIKDSTGSATTGTVTSVALSAPTIFTVSGSPVTTSGTLTFAPNNTTGDLIYGSGTNTLAYRAIGTTGQHLIVIGGVPVWRDTTVVPTSFPYWALASGGTLTAANTVTWNTEKWLNFTGTYTGTTWGDWAMMFNHTITGEPTARAGGASTSDSNIVKGYEFNPTITAGANVQKLTGVYMHGTYNINGKSTTTQTVLRLSNDGVSTVNQLALQGTANPNFVATFFVDASANLSIQNNAVITLNTTSINAGAFYSNSSTIATSTFGTASAGGLTTTNASYLFAGASTIGWRMGLRDGSDQTLAANVSAGAFVLAQNGFITAATGTHALVAGEVIRPVKFSTSTGAAVTSTATLYLDGAQSGTVTPTNPAYTLWASGTGTNRLDGGLQLSYVAKTANYTATAADHVIDLTTNTDTVTLPTAVGITGMTYTIKLTAATTGQVKTTSSQTIDAATTYNLTAQYKYVTVTSNGANWIIIANNGIEWWIMLAVLSLAFKRKRWYIHQKE
jgi:hypothetical protein